MSTDFAAAKRPARERLLALLSDLAWHTWAELRQAAGVRYGARLLELKRLGYAVDSDGAAKDGKRYRLAHAEPGSPQPKRVKVFLEERDAEAAVGGVLTAPARLAVRDAWMSFRANKEKL
jgi:hypothetical protein